MRPPARSSFSHRSYRCEMKAGCGGESFSRLSVQLALGCVGLASVYIAVYLGLPARMRMPDSARIVLLSLGHGGPCSREAEEGSESSRRPHIGPRRPLHQPAVSHTGTLRGEMGRTRGCLKCLGCQQVCYCAVHATFTLGARGVQGRYTHWGPSKRELAAPLHHSHALCSLHTAHRHR